MKVHIDIIPADGEPEGLDLEVPDGGTEEHLFALVAERLGLDAALLADTLEAPDTPEPGSQAGPLAPMYARQLRLVCVELHFTSEQATHRFPARAPWALVHRWGCRHFNVPAGDCAQLELRAEKPDGGLLNERRPIGEFKGCKVVWLVRPGAEPNG